MRLILLAGLGSSLCCGVAAAQAPRPTPRFVAAPAAVRAVADTTTRIRFRIPAQPLPRALGDFARQAGIRVEVDLAAAGTATSQAVAGSLTTAEALRQLLAGTGLAARFPDDGTALVSADVPGGAYTLTPITVVGERRRGYAAAWCAIAPIRNSRRASLARISRRSRGWSARWSSGASVPATRSIR